MFRFESLVNGTVTNSKDFKTRAEAQAHLRKIGTEIERNSETLGKTVLCGAQKANGRDFMLIYPDSSEKKLYSINLRVSKPNEP